MIAGNSSPGLGGGGQSGDTDLAAGLGVRTGRAWASQARIHPCLSLAGVFITHGDVGVGTIVGSAVFNILCIIGVCGLFAGQVRVSLPAGSDVRDSSGETRGPALAMALSPRLGESLSPAALSRILEGFGALGLPAGNT